MATEVLKLTAQIVISHVSMSELTPKELVEEIKGVYNTLIALEGGVALAEAPAEAPQEAEVVKKPPIPLDEIVKEKYVVCLECGKKMRTLKAHLNISVVMAWNPKSIPWCARNTLSSGAGWPRRKVWARRALDAKNRRKEGG
jgi:predicted transcriptional regulator